jgi:hypothetical protein
MGIGIPELLAILLFGAFSVLPLAAAVWALITLKQTRDRLDDIQAKLDAIGRQLQRP